MEIGFLNLLTLALLVLKVLGFLSISWIMVFIPTMVSFGIGFIVLIGVLFTAVLASLGD